MTEVPVAPVTDVPPVPQRPTLRERWARRPPPLGLLAGAGILSFYVFAALSALVVFRGSLNQLPQTASWVPIENALGPSAAHPFGVMAGFGTDLFDALWRATPWDLSMVAGILAIDVFLGLFLGALAGLDEGGLLDGIVTLVGDTVGSIPSFILVAVIFIGVLTEAPASLGLPLIVVVFGIILWPTMARAVRERARNIAHQRYVEAARASGASFSRILFAHVLPNTLGPVLAQVPLDVVPIFFVLSVFPWFWDCQYPGGEQVHITAPFGQFPPPYLIPLLPNFWPLPSGSFPEWGYLLGFGTCEGTSFPGSFDYWWMYLFPLLAIVGLGVAIGLVCDGIERWRRLER
jgi:peptide/nickel transport system permease protein